MHSRFASPTPGHVETSTQSPFNHSPTSTPCSFALLIKTSSLDLTAIATPYSPLFRQLFTSTNILIRSFELLHLSTQPLLRRIDLRPLRSLQPIHLTCSHSRPDYIPDLLAAFPFQERLRDDDYNSLPKQYPYSIGLFARRASTIALGGKTARGQPSHDGEQAQLHRPSIAIPWTIWKWSAIAVPERSPIAEVARCRRSTT